MKIHVLADLHLEFGDYAPAPVGADIVVLAGDIHIKGRAIPIIRKLFPATPVIYVPGNHEYYRGALPKLDDALRDAARNTNVHYLENAEWALGDVRFLGCALWTNFTLFGLIRRAECMAAAELALNDYAVIRISPEFRRLTPLHTAVLHMQSCRWLAERLSSPFPGRTVVVTHHAPSIQSLPENQREDPLSACFAENLESLILAHPPDLWIHGHTHHCVDYTIGSCRVLSNQRGYAHETAEGFRADLVVEISSSFDLPRHPSRLSWFTRSRNSPRPGI